MRKKTMKRNKRRWTLLWIKIVFESIHKECVIVYVWMCTFRFQEHSHNNPWTLYSLVQQNQFNSYARSLSIAAQMHRYCFKSLCFRHFLFYFKFLPQSKCIQSEFLLTSIRIKNLLGIFDVPALRRPSFFLSDKFVIYFCTLCDLLIFSTA